MRLTTEPKRASGGGLGPGASDPSSAKRQREKAGARGDGSPERGVDDLPSVPGGVPSGNGPSDRLLRLQRARARAAELRASGALPEAERLDPIERARRNSTSLRLAIAARCWECAGSGADPDPRGNIRNCKARGCPLLPVRPYAGAIVASRRDAINAKCRRCMGPDPCVVDRIRGCAIDCPLYAVRPYKFDATGEIRSDGNAKQGAATPLPAPLGSAQQPAAESVIGAA